MDKVIRYVLAVFVVLLASAVHAQSEFAKDIIVTGSVIFREIGEDGARVDTAYVLDKDRTITLNPVDTPEVLKKQLLPHITQKVVIDRRPGKDPEPKTIKFKDGKEDKSIIEGVLDFLFGE